MRLVPLVAVLALQGCFLNHGNNPEPEPDVRVDASISSASLGDICEGAPEGGEAGPRADDDDGFRIGDCDGIGCGCRQSSAQILFDVVEMQDPIDVEILGVRLLDSDERLVQTLAASNARAWREEYSAWDESLNTLGELQTLYDLSGVDWNAIGDGDPWRTYEMIFFLEITLQIGDERVVLLSGELMREPEIVT